MDEELADIPVNELLQEGLEPSSLPTVDAVLSGSDLIDATQNAIIDTAENVTQVFDSPQAISPAAIPAEPIYMEIEFWVGSAFVLTVLVLLKPLVKYVTEALHHRILRVLSDLEEAVKLRDDAQILLADYERKFANTKTQQEEINAATEKNLRNIKHYETAKMKDTFKIKEKELRRNLESEIESVRKELYTEASERSVELAQKAIEQYLQKSDQSRLIDDAIAELDRFIK